MDSNINDSPGTAGTATGSKKPYEKPSFRFEKVFVTTALICGKSQPLQGNCGQSMQAS